MNPKWLIHLKDGRTLTEKDCYPHEVDPEQITSVERVEGDMVITIMKSPCLTHPFVKSSASQDMNPFDGYISPAIVEERILGGWIPPSDKWTRVELVIVPNIRNVKLRAIEVDRMRKDGL